ncbi:DUF3349 domain-containing protein [Smaragdicoccus niigatensis]|uniref:DUF3349 domain-containing protein n=1 Tax=Smaragdicoccus niigatensis TaxID=359359 RepID=UPI00037B3C53|nr:DUF3349 domain-containing protein [Smaragdicoccus niigatensis]
MLGSHLTAPLRAVLQWLKAGFPQGVPQSDYAAVFAVLHRRLTDVEVTQIAAEFTETHADEPVTTAQIREAIAEVAMEEPGADDIARVTQTLKDAGFAVED